MDRTFLPFARPVIGDEEIREVVETLRSGWLTTGPKTKCFENEFMAYVGAKSALALNSCTAGLHLALIALGVGSGDEVISTAFTFVAAVNVVEHVGATPVLVDVEPDTLNLVPAQVEAAISPRTKAIMATHYAGHPADLDALRAIAQGHNLPLIEDAAHAVASRYKGQLIGSGDSIAAFSFYATKNLTTGEGGMLTGPVEMTDKARILALHGMSRDAWGRYERRGSWYYEVAQPGFKYNMPDLQASLGLCQLRRIDEFQARRRAVARAYTAAFGPVDALEPPLARPDVEHAWHLYTLRLRLDALTIGRDQFIEELTVRGIGTSVHFIPIHLHPYYRDKYGLGPEDFLVAFESYKRVFSLPIDPRLTDADVSSVIEAVLAVVADFRR